MTISDSIKEAFTSNPDLDGLHGLFLSGLQDIYFAEKQLVKALEKMAENSTSARLKQTFESHKAETEGQVERLEQVFELLDESPRTQTCEAIKGIISEADEIMDEAEGQVLDAGLVYAAQGAEHYEISRYGTLVAWAKLMGHAEAARLLEKTLKEEVAADERLSKLAESEINRNALTVDDMEGVATPRRSGSTGSHAPRH